MKKSTFQPDLAGARPTLLSAPRLVPLATGDTGEESILSSSKMGSVGSQQRQAATTRKGLQIFAVLGLSLAAVFLGYQYLSGNPAGSLLANAGDHSAAQTSVASAAQLGALPNAAAPVFSDPASPQVAAPVATAPEAAQIVNEPHLPAAASGAAKLTAALEEGVKPPATAMEKALERKASDQALPEMRTSPKAEKINTAMPKKASPTTNTRTAAAKKAPADAPDKDVNLLAALIAHNSGLSAPSSPASRKLAVANARTATTPQKSNASGLQPSEKMTTASRSPNREVVERQRSDTTASLLKRCGALGFIEGELCRLRICSGQWDTDAACKSSLSSNAMTANDNQKN
ncbi:MAG: hypothetical protein ABIQ90_08660 [Polaromonas sp.]